MNIIASIKRINKLSAKAISAKLLSGKDGNSEKELSELIKSKYSPLFKDVYEHFDENKFDLEFKFLGKKDVGLYRLVNNSMETSLWMNGVDFHPNKLVDNLYEDSSAVYKFKPKTKSLLIQFKKK